MTPTRATTTMGRMAHPEVEPRTAYLRELGAVLVGPRRVRRDLLQEAHDHLDDATDAYVRAGYAEDQAAARAAADFGSVEDVAPAYQTTLAVASSRRTALLLLTVLLVQPFIWDGPVNVSGATAADAPSGLAYAVLDVGVEVVGAGVMAAALLLALACGIGNRWFRAGRRIARVTALASLGAAVAMPLTGMAMTVLASGLAPAHWLLFAGFMLFPMALVAGSARRTLATC